MAFKMGFVVKPQDLERFGKLSPYCISQVQLIYLIGSLGNSITLVTKGNLE